MESSVDDLPGDVSGEAPRRRFPVVMRGYDRYQVDDHVEQTYLEMRQAREQVQALQQELAEAHRQLREQERPSSGGLGSRIEQLLRLAEQRAAEIVRDACAVANELQAAAEVDAAELRASAETTAAELRAQAKAQADQLMAGTTSEIDRHRAAAQREFDDLTRRKDSITGHLDQLRELLSTQIEPADGPPAEATEPGEIT